MSADCPRPIFVVIMVTLSIPTTPMVLQALYESAGYSVPPENLDVRVQPFDLGWIHSIICRILGYTQMKAAMYSAPA
jgi:hypothetical protein